MTDPEAYFRCSPGDFPGTIEPTNDFLLSSYWWSDQPTVLGRPRKWRLVDGSDVQSGSKRNDGARRGSKGELG